MQVDLDEAAFFATVFLAGHYLHLVSTCCFTALNHWAAGLALWAILISLLFAPSIYVPSHMTCDRPGTIFLGGLIGSLGALQDHGLATALGVQTDPLTDVSRHG